jgi:hypothetical protein
MGTRLQKSGAITTAWPNHNTAELAVTIAWPDCYNTVTTAWPANNDENVVTKKP